MNTEPEGVMITIPELVRQARRRLLWNEIAAQGMCAISVGLGVVVLLLLLGTQILDWRWMVILPALTLGIGVYRTVRRLPGSYATGQMVDRRLQLADSLSTALFFSSPASGRRANESMRAAQLAQAEHISQTVDLARAIPFQVPRAIYAAGLLALVATSLFALRYGLDRRLDLRPTLARILQQSFGGSEIELAAQQKKRMSRRPDLRDAVGITTPDGSGQAQGELDAAPDSALDTVDVPDVNPKQNAKEGSSSKGKTPAGDPMEGEQGESESTDDAQASNGGQAGADGQQNGGQSKQGQQNAANQSPGSAGDQNSLVSKLRDAMSNILSRMKQQPSGSSGQQQAQSQNGQEARGQKGSGQKARPGQGKQQQGGQDSDSQDGEAGQEAQDAQNAQGRGSGQSTDEQASKQPGSGIGKQDGNKDVKLAEQLAVMGKISEIIGKRSANVSGEVTVEVQSGNQQLKTAYTQKNAEHTNASGEINRDEVPVVLQTYVQQYFEQVRKQEAPAAAKDAAKKPPAKR